MKDQVFSLNEREVKETESSDRKLAKDASEGKVQPRVFKLVRFWVSFEYKSRIWNKLSGLKKAKMAMYSITSKLNSTFTNRAID